MRRGFEDSGTVEGEHMDDALLALVHQGRFWDRLDTDEEVTITIRPVSE